MKDNMSIPKTIKIGRVKYKIKFKDIEGSCLGYHEASKNVRNIVIDNELKGNVLYNVFFHELTHAILYEIGSEESENELFVQSFGNVLQQVNEQIYKKDEEDKII